MLNASDAAALKKLLEYDPYLDPNLAPKMPREWDDQKYLAAHPEVAKEAEEKKKQAEEAINKLRNDKEANVIFARQDCQIKDGVSLGLDREKIYLYLSADDTFFAGAEAKLKKNFSSMERAPEETEKQIIDTLEKEKEKADEGLGFIFG